MNRKLLVLVAGLAACLLIGLSPVHSQGGNPLPPLPSDQAIGRVVRAAAVRSLTSVKMPGIAIKGAPTGIAANLDTRADTAKTATAFGLDARLKQSISPLVGSEKGVFAADAQTPDDKQPAQALGLIGTANGTRAVMLVFKDGQPNAIRFYDKNGLVQDDSTNSKFVLRQLIGTDQGLPAVGDQGVIIGARETCFTVGLQQACYATAKFTPDDKVVAQAQAALKALTAAYNVSVQFDTDGALAELLGNTPRKGCDDALTKLTALKSDAITGCQPNLIFAASTTIVDGQPIGLFRVLKAADVQVFDTSGRLVGSLPAGDYFVLNATPADSRAIPGSPGALFLVSANGKDNFLLPSRVVEGFGSTGDADATKNTIQAGIKNGFINGQDF